MDDFPERLHHKTPGWVKSGALFHVRIRLEKDAPFQLTDETKAGVFLSAARLYHETGKWRCHLILIMPDHVHAILAFPVDGAMAVVVRNWKRATARMHSVKWQENYFDHRLRTDEESAKTWIYIRRNPVVKGLCEAEDDWRWWWSGTLA
ncbi:MAG: transposase [Opitutaceae bacterium]|nr:transposase [Opitutaceae bacterium]